MAKSRDVIKKLTTEGWVLKKIRGEHHQYVNCYGKKVTV